MAYREYIGSRYVPIFGRKDETSIDWDNSKPYEPLTIVLYQGNSYTSRQYVPIGVDIANTDYWAKTGNYNAQIDQYRQEVSAYNMRIETLEGDFPVTSANIADGAITASKIAAGAVESSKIANGAVTVDKIANSSVESSKIANGAVGANQIANGAVESSKIANGAVGSSQIANGAVGSSQIANGAVTADQIAQGAITADKMASGASAEYVKLSGNITSFQEDGMGTHTFSSSDLANAGITNINEWTVIGVETQRVLLNAESPGLWECVQGMTHTFNNTTVANVSVVKRESNAGVSPNTLYINIYNQGASSRHFRIILAKLS